MSILHSPPQFPIDTHAYFKFVGLDTTRDPASMDVGENQPLIELNNAYCDKHGQIVADNGAVPLIQANVVGHIRNHSFNKLTWAQINDGGISLHAQGGHDSEMVFNKHTSVTSTLFNRDVYVFGYGQIPQVYNGAKWDKVESGTLTRLAPSFGVSIQRRLLVAGCLSDVTTLYASHVDEPTVFEDEEPSETTSVLRAGSLDIRNLLNTADIITGLASFEQSRLVIFTNDKAIIYKLDPDITRWELDERANVNVGCCSHNTIANAGTDVLFCSRYGVHSIKRSEENGIMVYSYPMSEDIEELYRELFSTVEFPEQINAVWDQDEAQYHVFFPQRDGVTARRLTMTMPAQFAEGSAPHWSTGDFLNARCASTLSGQLYVGTPAGIYAAVRSTKNCPPPDNAVFPTALVTTPILWNGTMTKTKNAYSLILQATGKGQIKLTASNEAGATIFAQNIEISAQDNQRFTSSPLTENYEIRFEVRYRGVQFQLEIDSSQSTRLNGIAINTRKN